MTSSRQSPDFSKLDEYIHADNTEGIQSIIDQVKLPWNWYDQKEFIDALRNAISLGKKDIVDLFFRAGIPTYLLIEDENNNKHSWLYYAVKNGQLEIVQYLVEKRRANIQPFNQRHQSGSNEGIEAAITFNQPTIADYLLNKGAELDDEGNFFDPRTYLAKAAALAHEEVMDVFVKHGASLADALYTTYLNYQKKIKTHQSTLFYEYQDIHLENIIDLAKQERFKTEKEELLMQVNQLKSQYRKNVQMILDHMVGHDLKPYRWYMNHGDKSLQFLDLLDDLSGLNFIGITLNGESDVLTHLRKKKIKGVENILVSEKDLSTIADSFRKHNLQIRIDRYKTERGFETTTSGFLNVKPLWQAVVDHDDAIVIHRLSNNADPNECDLNGVPAILLAAKHGYRTIVNVLATHEKINKQLLVDAISVAHSHGHTDVINDLLAHFDINTQNSAGDSVLHKAAAGGDADWIKVLMRYSPDINLTNRLGQTPLCVATSKAWNISEFSENLNAYEEVAETLLAAGADANKFYSSSPLHCAVGASSARMVELLLPVTSKTDITKRTHDGKENHYPWYTELFRTAYFGKHAHEILLLLQAAGANFNALYSDGQTMLHEAAFRIGMSPENKGILMMEFLLAHGADPTIKDQYTNQLPLHVISNNKRLRVCDAYVQLLKLLVPKMSGEAINAQDHHGKTALHYEAEKGNHFAIQYLCEQGADTKIIDKNGKTALDYARLSKSSLATQALMEALKFEKSSVFQTPNLTTFATQQKAPTMPDSIESSQLKR